MAGAPLKARTGCLSGGYLEEEIGPLTTLLALSTFRLRQ